MRALIVTLLFFLFQGEMVGQSNWPYRVPAGVRVESIVPFDELYLFPDFRKCAIFYVDGNTSLAMANYSLLYQKMVLISVKKDTTFLKNDYLVQKYDFGGMVILNDYKYGLVEVQNDSLFPKLARKDFVHLIPVDEGTFDGYSNFVDPSTTNIVLRRVGNDTDRVLEDQFARSNIIVEKKVAFFLVDRNQRVFPASGKNIYRILPRYKNEIRDFIKNESIDLKSEEGLVRLLSFCQNL
ncbi:MAG: hypothetical protein RIE59_10175 [Imperialibacter sp.]